MTPMLHAQIVSSDTGGAVHLMLTTGEIALMPEQVMEEIQLRATKVGSILEGILHEAHGNDQWGADE